MEDNWITEMTIFLTTELPPQQLSSDERKRLAVHSRNFCILNNNLYRQRADRIWRRAVWQFEKSVILWESHCGIAGGHYAGEATGRKIWNSGLWCPTVMKDVLGNMSLRMEDAKNRLNTEPAPIGPTDCYGRLCK